MKQTIKDRLKNQQGEVMLEAALILLPILIMLMMLLALSFFFYQQAAITSIATEIASDVAKNYKYTTLNIGEETISLDNLSSGTTSSKNRPIKMFRMSFSKRGLEKAHRQRAEEYIARRLPASTLGLKSEDATVTCEIEYSGIGRAYVKVTVSQQPELFLGEILQLTGILDPDSGLSATAYAECVDPMGYTSMINFAQYMAVKLEALNPVGELYYNGKDLINSISDFFGTLTG